MTPEQLDHLRAIDAHLTALLALAAKRTPGGWYAEDPHENYCGNPYCSVNGCPENHPSGDIVLNGPEYDGFQDSELRMHPRDAAYIAACAGRAEAGWLNTKDEIAYLIAFDKNCRGWQDDNGCAGAAIQHIQHRIAKICERWPRELLTLP